MKLIVPKPPPNPCRSDPRTVCPDMGLCGDDVNDQEIFVASFWICAWEDRAEAAPPTLGPLTSLNSRLALDFLLPSHLCSGGCAQAY